MAVVVEPERALGIRRLKFLLGFGAPFCRNAGRDLLARRSLATHRKVLFGRRNAFDGVPALGLRRSVLVDEAPDLFCRLERDVFTAAEPHAQLTVVDGEPAERGFGHP